MSVTRGVSQFIEYNTGDSVPTTGLTPGAFAINKDTQEVFSWSGAAWKPVNKTMKYYTGYWDYNDLATQSSPFAITGGAGFVNLPNDGLGPYTDTSQKPDSLGDVWNVGAKAFDFSGLAIGDQVMIRFTAEVTTLSPNTDIAVKMRLGSESPYDITIITEQNIKDTGTHQLSRYTKLYIGNLDTKDSPAFIQMKASANVNVVIEGWYVSVFRRS